MYLYIYKVAVRKVVQCKYIQIHIYQKAIKYFESLETSTAVSDQSEIMTIWVLSVANQENIKEQLNITKKFRYNHINNAIGDQTKIAITNGNLGDAYHSSGEYEQAIKYHESSLELSTAIENESQKANNNGKLGNAYHSLGKYQKAIQYYKKCLEISTVIGDQSGIASNHSNLGNVYHNLGQSEKAIKYYEKG